MQKVIGFWNGKVFKHTFWPVNPRWMKAANQRSLVICIKISRRSFTTKSWRNNFTWKTFLPTQVGNGVLPVFALAPHLPQSFWIHSGQIGSVFPQPETWGRNTNQMLQRSNHSPASWSTLPGSSHLQDQDLGSEDKYLRHTQLRSIKRRIQEQHSDHGQPCQGSGW